jgi:membrane-bound metal-dependent hydrolase YbcI (DUF457 family)
VNWQTLVGGVALVSLGGLTPDLDNEKNKIYTLLPVGQRTFAEIFERVFGKHRSISHSFLGMAILGGVSYWLIMRIPEANGFNKLYLWWSYILAMVAHVAADMYTREGVPLLWPLRVSFYGIPIRALRIKTGGWVENVLIEGFFALLILGMSYYYWDRVVELFTF